MMPIVHVSYLQQQDYPQCYRAMQTFTLNRDANTHDQIWVLEHPPVYTLGLNSQAEHVLNPRNIPVVQTDRGGQVTYHGPGQLMVYFLLDLKRHSFTVKDFVRRLEQVIIDLLHHEYGLVSTRKAGAPGVYIDDKKIAALGLRVKHGRCYHGFSLNVDMDLSPFSGINPCGYEGLEITQLKDFGITESVVDVANKLLPIISKELALDLHLSKSSSLTEAA